ncbi:MAG: hypothetical protein ACYTF6_12025 [Planctomycetota bacterium]|jgi:hypothetical protein
MSVSEVSICNQALGWLGQDPLTSLEDQNVRGDLCRANYPVLRDTMLEDRAWSFAQRRERSETADQDSISSLYKHTVDEDWLLILRVFEDTNSLRAPYDSQAVQAQWHREGDFVYAKSSVVYLWGITRVTDVTKYTEGFRQALAARLAADMAIPLTENRNLQSDMWALYERKLNEASVRDGQQGRNERVGNSRLIAVRSGV